MCLNALNHNLTRSAKHSLLLIGWSVFLISLLGLKTPAAKADFSVPNVNQSLITANESYHKGAYAEAANAYEQALATGLHNGHIYYNLANAYYRQGAIGRAIFNYRRALILLPADPDIRANLSLARKQTKDNLWSETNIPVNSKFVLANYLAPQQLRLTFILSYLVFWALIFVQHDRNKHSLKIFVACYAFFLLWITASYFTIRPSWNGQYEFSLNLGPASIRPAVVITDEINVYSGDSDHYQVVFVLHQGAEIMAAEQRGLWLRIMLPDGKQGWTQSAHLAFP